MLKLNSILLLRITILAGLILMAAAGGTLTVFLLMERSMGKTARQYDNFYRSLRQYDIDAEVFYGTEREAEHLNRELDKLEKNAVSVEAWLSVLKRRRALSSLHHPSLANYRASVKKAQAAYPFSQQTALIAAAAEIKDTALNGEAEERLRESLALISDPSFNTPRLAFHVLLGDFKNPKRAAAIPPGILTDGTESITIDLAIMKILPANFTGAAPDIQLLMNSSPSREALFFAAEYFYDAGDLLRSAEIFSMIDDEKAMIRQADALYLAGFPQSARSIWLMLSDTENDNSLYNLALTSEGAESEYYLQRLINRETFSSADSLEAGIIRYSRMLDNSEALSVLQSRLPPSSRPLVDLEIVKRNMQGPDPGRRIAQTWLLLDRHPEDEELYNWAAWCFLIQRRFDEARIFLDRLDQLGLDAVWADIYRAIFYMIEGSTEKAENILLSIPPEDASWIVHANLGRIMEAQRNIRGALEKYELAALTAKNNKTAANIHLRIAMCYSVLNRPAERQRTLLTAQELDPDNLTVRLELDRY